MAKFYLSKRLLVVALLLCGGLSAFSQQKIAVTGKVTLKEDGSPAPGVNVLEQGTNNGAVTEVDGTYHITVAENATLTVTFIGYKSQEVAVGNRSTVDVVLEADVATLGEVLVIGYGLQEKKDVTGSIVGVSQKEFNRGVLASPQDLLIGKVAGVQITTNDGAPGAGSQIRIRGTNSIAGSSDPLIVIDGFAVDNGTQNGIGGLANPLSLINPNDIESINVLKDASATAIYGLRAANGVIVITTKKGKSGKPEITYNGNYSLSSPMKYFDVMNGDEFRATAAQQLALGHAGLTDAAIARLGTANTDWQKEIFRTSFSHDHNIGLSGTWKSMPYRVSYGYTDQEGILKTTNFKRNSINVNLTPSFFEDALQITASFKGSDTRQNFGNGGAIGAAAAFDPTQPVMNGNTTYGGYTTSTTDGTPDGPANTIAVANPVALLNQTTNTSKVLRGIGSLKLDYRLPFFKDIKLTANGGFDYSTSDGINNNPNNTGFTAVQGFGNLNNYTETHRSKLLDLYANYSKKIGAHNFDVTAGYSYQDFDVRSTSFIRNGQTPPLYLKSQDKLDASGNPILDGDNNKVQEPYHALPYINNILAYFGRVNYSFKDKYLFTASMRDDASSRYSKENRYHVFPSAALGWRISQEGFMGSVPVISDLKLRGSYGVTGNQNITPGTSQSNSYPYLGLYQQGQNIFQYQFGSGFVTTQRPGAYDANLRWETTAQTDIGLDFGLWSNRLTGAIDYYEKKTTDLINTIPIPLGTNFSNSLATNVGNMTNKGIEVALKAIAVKTQDVEWNIGLNVSHNENKITKLLRNPDPADQGIPTGGISGGLGGNIQNQQVGYPINSFFVYQQVYDQAGKPIEGLYTDRSGQGGVVSGNNANLFRYHSPQAKALIGLNSRVNYKKFDFSFSGRLSIGNYVYNNNQSSKAYYQNMFVQSGFFVNLPRGINDTHFLSPQYFSTYYVQNASFFKMDNISLGYNMTNIMDTRLRGRVGLTVTNAFFITKYKGVDPETTNGIDNNVYPRPRTFMLSLNLSF